MVTVIVKDKKMQYKRYTTVSIKISFTHYITSRKVMFPVAFEEFQMVYIFCYVCLLTIIVNGQNW